MNRVSVNKTQQPMSASSMQQRGAALIVAMIMLLLLTLIGVAGMRNTLLQEKMAGNMRDREIALQAAEAALRAGELQLQEATLPPFTGSGFYEIMDREVNGNAVTELAFWKNWGWDNNDSVEYTENLEGIDRAPRYVIEKLTGMSSEPDPAQSQGGSASPIVQAVDLTSGEFKDTSKEDYRVTAMGWGLSEDAVVIIQSTYRRN